MRMRDLLLGGGMRIALSAVVVAMLAAGAVAYADPPAEGGTGIELVGRPEAWPQHWTATDKATGTVAARVERKWGFAELPPGDYALAILPRGHEPVEVRWGDVKVEDAKVTRVDVTSGVEVVGRSEDDGVLDSWDVIDAATGKTVAHAWHRWGFTPLPAGAYALRIRPTGHETVEIAWADVRVEAGKATRVAIDTGIELVGRSEKDDILDHWDAIDKATGEKRAHAWFRWGFTPLPPGTYALRIRPRGHESVELAWGDVAVEKGRTTTVALRSGIELVPRAEGEEPLEHWDVVDRASGKTVVHAWRKWGFAPLPPGGYAVRIRPMGAEAIEVPWVETDVVEGSAVAVRIDSGVDVVGRPGREPPEYWLVHDAKSRAPVAKVYRRWGFTPLRPGTYEVFRSPRRWPAVEVKAGQVVSLAEPEPAARWAAVSGAGRKTEKERDPEGYRRLEEEIERAIRRAAAWLKTHGQVARMDPLHADGHPTIEILALVHAGELERDPALARRCRDYLMRRALNDAYGTYVTAVTAMALCDMGALRNRTRIFDCATWLVENPGWGESPNKVWGYGDPVPGFDAKPAHGAGPKPRESRPKDVVRAGLVASPREDWDNSNAQFGVLGLHSAARARVGIPKESWERVESHFREVHGREGGWGYSIGGETGSMTCAGVASLVVARHHLGAQQPALDPVVLDGLEWLESNFTVEENPGQGSSSHHYYYLYGLERVGVLAGTEFIGEHEWYPTGARYLLKEQQANGLWSRENYLDTCYAILFLRRATLPLETTPPALLSVTRDETAMRRDMPAVELILDCSGSMKEPVDGRPKMAVAREVITEVLSALPAEMQVGLRLYGHRQPPQKTDTELVVPIGALDEGRRSTIQAWVDRAQPRGWTPMVHSLLQAKDDFGAAGKGSRTVVLVSDGEETGGGKVEDVAAAYRGSGIEVVIHVVGFDVQGIPLAQQQMKEIARIGKGRYYGARNARELSQALLAAMPSPGFEVLDAGGTPVARGSLNGDPVEVKPGTYRVRLTGADSDPLEVSLEADQELGLRVDDAGKLVPAGS